MLGSATICDTPPIRRDWAAWLFLILAASAILTVLIAVNSSANRSTQALHRTPLAPPADVVPAVLPMDLAPITTEDAKAQNAQVPFVLSHLIAARPLHYIGSADNRARARDCLAAAMLYEAGDDTKGQRAVAQVVINRARHPAFPRSICAVVFQGSERATGCQFSFTCDGALNRRYSDAAWRRARDGANLALSGSVDPAVGLATHYHTDWVRPYWSDSLEKIAAVDTHLFFRWPGFWGTPAAFRGGVSEVEPGEAKMAPLSPAHAALLPGEVPGSGMGVAIGDPKVITGAGTALGRDSIYVVLDRKAAPESFIMLALRLCGERAFCKFMGWTNPMFKPEGEIVNDTSRDAMSFSYLRDEKSGFEKALWNCAEFSRDDTRECMRRIGGVLRRPVKAGSDISPPSASH